MEILSKTNMIDYAIDIRKQLYPRDEVPEDLKQRRQHVVAQLQELQQEVEPILHIMGNEEVMKNMENMRDSKTLITYLEKEVKVGDNFCFHLHLILTMTVDSLIWIWLILCTHWLNTDMSVVTIQSPLHTCIFVSWSCLQVIKIT